MCRRHVCGLGIRKIGDTAVRGIVEMGKFVETINSAVKLARDGDVALLLIDSPPVNALGHAVREGIALGLARALVGAPIAIVIACGGRTFCAGADIAEFDKPFVPPSLPEVFVGIEAASVPVVAAIHGTALGGGFELALACHYRVALASAQVGLPEVNLGLLPGAGGTQRVPRLAGIEFALELIGGGRPISATKARETGLVDAVFESGDLIRQAVDFARDAASQGKLPRIRDLPVAMNADEAQAAADRYRERNARMFKGFKAPANILKAIVAAAALPFDQGLEREGELFEELLHSDEAAAQMYAFFSERATTRVPGIDRNVAIQRVASSAVIGAGTMGTGIAIALLNADLPVVLVDLNREALDKAQARIAGTIRAMAEKGRIRADKAEAQVAALSTSTEMAAVGEVDLVIEAVFEKMELKQAIFRQLDQAAKPGAILATNTSYLNIDEIAAVTARPESVVGLHFFAPANLMRLLEIVRGKQTGDSTLATAIDLGKRLGKLGVVSGVCDGFIANRLMAQRGAAADRLILEGATPADADRAMRDYGFPMGHFQMLDLVGLEVVGWDRENSAGRTVQEILCEGGNLGQKSGSGYYDYATSPPQPAASALNAIATIRTRHGIATRQFSDQELVFELLDPVVNEGAKLVEEGIVYRASDIDMALIAGYGWPVHKGGPMFWGDTVGLAAICERLKTRQARGEAIVISPLLESHAAHGKRFVRD